MEAIKQEIDKVLLACMREVDPIPIDEDHLQTVYNTVSLFSIVSRLCNLLFSLKNGLL